MDIVKDSPEAKAYVSNMWREVKGGVFEDAVRKRWGLSIEDRDDWKIDVEVFGGGQVQIGDYTWDSVPYEFEVTATQMTIQWRSPWKNRPAFPQLTPVTGKHKTKTFNSLPEIWAWIAEEAS